MSQETRERNILIIASTAHFLVHFSMILFPSLALAMRADFGLSFDQVISLGFWMYLLYGLGALPFGVLADFWQRPRLLLLISLCGIGLCSIAAAVAPGPGSLSWALTGIGVFAAIYHPAGLAWISRDIRRRGWALGVNGVAGNLGVVAAPLVAGLLAVSFGWRSAYFVLAAPALAAAAMGFLQGDGNHVRESDSEAPAAPAKRPFAIFNSRRRHLIAFAILAAAMMMGGISYRGQTLVLPAWFEVQGLMLPQSLTAVFGSLSEGALLSATLLTSLAYIAGALGQIVGGHLADSHDLRRVYFLCHLLSLPCLLVMGWVSGVPLLLAAMAYAFFAFGMQPAENSLVAELTPPALRSTGYGLKFVLVFGVGALAVKLVGAWEQSGGLGSVFPRLAIFVGGLLGLVILLMIWTRGVRLRN